MSFNLQTKIAFLGMGLMGSRMASRLLNAGFQVAVWNRTASACDELVAQGATKLNLNEIGQYPIMLTCLADDSAVQGVIDQIADYLQPQQVIVDFSSLSVDKTKSLAKQVQAKNAIWIDSPVSGGTIGAEQGSLVIFAGGDAHVIESLAIVYDVLSQRVTRMGETGTGQATKICNQLIVAANSTLIAAVQTLSKDLNNAVKLAEQFNLDIPVAKRALSQLKDHQTQGFSEADLATVIQHVEPK